MPVSPARAAAYEMLLRVERESSYASDLLHSPKYGHLSSRDHALATELVLGVLRWRSRLDEELAESSSQSLSKLDLEVLVALRLGLYQLRCLNRIPKRAALYESAELMKLARKRSAVPFVNGVLRKLSGKSLKYDLEGSSENTSPESIASALAHPPWLVERWAKEYGISAARKICAYDQSVPATAIRLRTPAAEHNLQQEGLVLRPSQLLSFARIVQSGGITKTRAVREGRVVIQDPASQLVAALVGDVKRETNSRSSLRILDCCAAPGGKTLAMADRNPGAEITAVELHLHRARLLQKLLRAAGDQGNVAVIVGNAEQLPLLSPFERVLADVPCSGTGTLARNPEIKWRLRPQDLHDLQARQFAILQSSLAQLKIGGRLVYSTCSLEKEENEIVVERALSQNSSLRVIDCRSELDRLKQSGELVWPDVNSLTREAYLRTIPGIHPCDGFFAAILGKI
jgi:16S rRNA (cytosine967-C5)-methyltransferase